jgi:RNA polymerase sigma-70 factor (ECF subfamily)
MQRRPRKHVISPQAALDIVERPPLEDYQYLHSTRAELLRRLGRTDDARIAYERALQLTRTEPERQFLKRRLGEHRLPARRAESCRHR